MPCHPDRVREFAGVVELRKADAPIRIFAPDIRSLLDRLDSEYVGADVSAVMKRLREVVGYGN